MITRTTLAATAGLALLLGACGDPEVEETEEVALPDESANTTTLVVFDPLSRDYTLSSEQQARRDEFNQEQFSTEYQGYRTEMSQDPSMSSMTRENMQYSNLDRDSDGQLSVAEYAIYAAPAGSTELDETQTSQIADSYYYFDTDGDGSLSESEFNSLRSGGGADAGASAGMNSGTMAPATDAEATMSTEETM